RDFNLFQNRAKKYYYWSHDVPLTEREIDGCDGALLLSNYHKSTFIEINVPYLICGNGVIEKDFQNPMLYKNPYSCGYYSNYSRGLSILLFIWPKIKEKFPKATLDIYYGRNVYGATSDMELERIIKNIKLLEHLDVKERGCVSHKELANAMCN